MAKYQVNKQEIWVRVCQVEAESAEHAISKVIDRDRGVAQRPPVYVRTRNENTNEWIVKNLDEMEVRFERLMNNAAQAAQPAEQPAAQDEPEDVIFPEQV